MHRKSDAASVGVGRQHPNPQDKIDAEYGTYSDRAASLSPEQKYPVSETCKCPSPFRGLVSSGGPDTFQ